MRRQLGGTDEVEVRAAGGVVVDRRGDAPTVALIHRPKYEDWTLPKGKLEPGESWEQAALREVREETGYECELEGELEPARYVDRKGRPKLVRYWRMRAIDGDFTANDEVDELRWLAPEHAAQLLSYEHDRSLVELALREPPTNVQDQAPGS